MNYKASIDLFRSRYQTEAYNRGKTVKNLTNGEVMMYLSSAQNYLQANFGVYEKLHTLDLVSGQSDYAVGNTATTIPSDLQNINTIETAGNVEPIILDRVSKDQMNLELKANGLPTKYTVYGSNNSRVLELNSLPDASYDLTVYPRHRLNILYAPKLEIFSGSNGTFADYDEAQADFGGEWKIPSEWHGLIIDGALGYVYGDLMSKFYAMAQEFANNRPTYIELGGNYYLGVENNFDKR